MDYIFEKVAYLRGLTDGLDIDEATKEGRLLVKIVETLEDFADVISDLDEEVEELVEFIDVIDEDLADLEEFLYDSEDDFDEFECPKCGTVMFLDEDDFDENGNVELVCPECGEEYVVTDDFCCCYDEEEEKKEEEEKEEEN